MVGARGATEGVASACCILEELSVVEGLAPLGIIEGIRRKSLTFWHDHGILEYPDVQLRFDAKYRPGGYY